MKVHDKVLLQLPTSTNKLMAEWKGPYKVIDQVSPVDYTVKLNKKTSKTFHINMMKKWHESQEDGKNDEENIEDTLDEDENNQFHSICFISNKEEDSSYTDIENPLLVPQESVSDIKMDSLLSDDQKQ